MYSNFQGEGCNIFFEENEFFGKDATKKKIPGGTVWHPVIYQEVFQHRNFLMNINLEM